MLNSFTMVEIDQMHETTSWLEEEQTESWVGRRFFLGFLVGRRLRKHSWFIQSRCAPFDSPFSYDLPLFFDWFFFSLRHVTVVLQGKDRMAKALPTNEPAVFLFKKDSFFSFWTLLWITLFYTLTSHSHHHGIAYTQSRDAHAVHSHGISLCLWGRLFRLQNIL